MAITGENQAEYDAAPLVLYTCRTEGCECEGISNAIPTPGGAGAMPFICGGCGLLIEDVAAAPASTDPGVQPVQNPDTEPTSEK